MARAKSDTSYRVMMPDHARANENSVRRVWDCPGDMVAIAFESGVIAYERSNDLANHERIFQRMAEEYPEFSVGRIRGDPAQFSDPTKAENETAEGGVDWIEDGMRYTVSGDGKIALSELKEVAASLQPAE